MEFLPWSLIFFDSSQDMEKVRLLNANFTASLPAILHLSESEHSSLGPDSSGLVSPFMEYV